MFDFCDRIIACPLLFFILSGLFLFFLLIALLTLFGLHPGKLFLRILTSTSLNAYRFHEDINSARRYYGIISTLSIVNRTKYIFNLDQLCSATSFASNCLNIVTSTAINNFATTITINRTITTVNYSYILLIFGLIISCINRNMCLYTI